MAGLEPPLDDAVLLQVCHVLGDTSTGLTNREIDKLLADARIPDPTSRNAGPGTYVALSKRDRLHAALATVQRKTGSSSAVIQFIRKAMHPARYADDPALFEDRRHQLNVALSFASLELRETGEMGRTTAAMTLTDARRRAKRLRRILEERGAHPRLIAACVDEIRDDNYFHAVLEASKSLAEELRRQTGGHLDGVQLVEAALQPTKANPVPLLALNRLQTQTERSRQQGLEAGLRAIFSAARNPAAHEPKALSTLTEQDAVDLLTQISYLHRRLDECTNTGQLRSP